MNKKWSDVSVGDWVMFDHRKFQVLEVSRKKGINIKLDIGWVFLDGKVCDYCESPNVYVVTMRRYGDTERHSYVLGVWKNKTEAEKAGEAETDIRGGKYEPDISLWTI